MVLRHTKIGVWGLGIVGKSLVQFLKSQGAHVSVLDTCISDEQKQLLIQQNITVYDADKLTTFFSDNTYVIPSPGIDVTLFTIDTTKLLSELDLFATFYKKPYIAITGTLGKTSITTLLSQALRTNNNSIFIGGNIGVGCCDAIIDQNCYDYAVLEVSSFQTEKATLFSPQLAIISNIFPNHLDRHETEQNYLKAKLTIIRNQQKDQIALVPISLADQLTRYKTASTLHCFSVQPPTKKQLALLPKQSAAYWIEDNQIIRRHNNKTTSIYSIPAIHNHFEENILIVASALDLLQQKFIFDLQKDTYLEHRKEFVATINGINFINDSKSTVPEATLAALQALPKMPTILFLGGISKGIDRQPLIKQLPLHIMHVICFGKEKELLQQFLNQSTISYSTHDTLENAFAYAITLAQPNMQILFSPAGASFDLFTDYKDRGKQFKKLVAKIKTP